jgi:hypothetical protein
VSAALRLIEGPGEQEQLPDLPSPEVIELHERARALSQHSRAASTRATYSGCSCHGARAGALTPAQYQCCQSLAEILGTQGASENRVRRFAPRPGAHAVPPGHSPLLISTAAEKGPGRSRGELRRGTAAETRKAGRRAGLSVHSTALTR